MRHVIKNACVITVNGDGDVFDPGFVLVDGAHIAAVGPMTALPAGPFDRETDAQGGFVVPGLINLHQHAYMNMSKGAADGLRLEYWTVNLMGATRALMQREDHLAVTRIAALDMLRGGTTTFFNHILRPDWPDGEGEIAGIYAGMGLRHVYGLAYQIRTPKQPDHPFGPAEATANIHALVDRLDDASNDMTRCALVVECNAHHTAAGRSSDELVLAGHAVARERGLKIASHMSAGTLSMQFGFTMYKRLTGRSDVEYLESLGVLDDSWLLIHGIHFSDNDIGLIRKRGAAVVYTPTSESMRGGGIGPWVTMRDAGITCALGSDGPAVDYSVDMVEQLKATCMLQSLRYRDAEAFSPEDALRMGTIWGAQAIGMDDRLGSLETGKRADVVLFSRDRAAQILTDDPVRAFVMATHGGDARLVMVNGTISYQDGRFGDGIDVDAILADVQERSERIHRAPGLDARTLLNWPARRPAADAQA